MMTEKQPMKRPRLIFQNPYLTPPRLEWAVPRYYLCPGEFGKLCSEIEYKELGVGYKKDDGGWWFG